MTITFSIADIPPVDLLAETHQLYTHTAEELVLAVNAIKAGRFEEVRSAQASVRDLKAAFFLVMDERAKLDKLRKQISGTVGTGGLDLHAARDEIGRRLARLRDANGG